MNDLLKEIIYLFNFPNSESFNISILAKIDLQVEGSFEMKQAKTMKRTKTMMDSGDMASNFLCVVTAANY